MSQFGLDWLRDQIAENMRRARTALEDFAEDQGRRTEDLDVCAVAVHQVRGALEILELYGASLLAEEMESLIDAIRRAAVDEPDEAEQVLMQAILQLPAYLDRIESGVPDSPVILLPLLNDIRAVKGQPLLSESSVFAPDLSIPLPLPQNGARVPKDPQRFARELRRYYLKGLVDWYRGSPTGLPLLKATLDHLERTFAARPVGRQWWVSVGFVEALLDGGLEPSVSVKLLLGQGERQLKRLVDEGESALVREPPADLMKNLLYYIARADSNGERVQAIKSLYRLDKLLPSGRTLELVREAMAGPDREALGAVASVLLDELAHAKDQLDIFADSDRRTADRLGEMVDSLGHTADTLGMLGLGAERRLLARREASLREAIAAGTVPSDDGLMDVASTLLEVESAVQRLVETGTETFDGEALNTDSQSHLELEKVRVVLLRSVRAAVIREAKANLTTVKDAITALVLAPGETGPVAGVPRWLAEVAGALAMAELDTAEALVRTLGTTLETTVLSPEFDPSPGKLADLAEVIVGIEAGLEALAGGRGDGAESLGAAREMLERMSVSEPAEVLEDTPVTPDSDQPEAPPDAAQPTLPPSAEVNLARAGERLAAMEPPQDAEAGAQTPAASAARTPTTATAEEATPPAFPTSRPADVDEEIAEVFVEEANEVLESIRGHLPLWRRDLEDREALVVIRRGFHTLKGSGRLAGAAAIGEVAWAAERVLNDIIDQAMAPAPAVLKLVEDIAEILPALVAEFDGGAACDIDVGPLIARAESDLEIGTSDAQAMPQRLEPEDEPEPEAGNGPGGGGASPMAGTAGTVGAAPALPESASATQGKEEVEVQASESDAGVASGDFLREVFLEEASGHLEALGMTLEACRNAGGKCTVSRDLIRRLHTLHGASRVAEVRALGDLAAALEACCVRLRAVDGHLQGKALDLFGGAIDRMSGMLETLRAGGAPDNAVDLLASIHGLEPTAAPTAGAATGKKVGPKGAAPVAGAAEDEDLRSVFIDEAAEILDTTDSLLAQWLASPEKRAALRGLQRELHTLKGGARSAGFVNMGDLSHAVESLLTAVGDGRIALSDSLADLVQHAQDVLVHMRDQARAGEPTGSVPELLARIQALGKGEQGDAEGPTPVGEPDTSGPTDEPSASGPGVAPAPSRPHEQIRVDAGLLDRLSGFAGEINITHSRIGQSLNAYRYNLEEMDRTIDRLQAQLRSMDMETEAQILFRHEATGTALDEDFDPLELDRYSKLQQLSRSLMESVSDLGSIRELLGDLTGAAESLLVQQSRLTTGLQQGLMETRMVPLAGVVPRLGRLVRHTARELGKRASFVVSGAEVELDRMVLNRMIGPLEHMLRNAVFHGVESEDARRQAGKPVEGTVRLDVGREAGEVVLRLADDGAGLDLAGIRAKAVERGLMRPDAALSDHELMQFILEPAFSTAGALSQISGRGVGMDVVNNELKQLGGRLDIDSVTGHGTTFTVRLPLTLTLSRVLMVRAGDERLAVPLNSVELVVRVPQGELAQTFRARVPSLEHGGESYRLHHLGALLGIGAPRHDPRGLPLPALLVRTADHRIAFQVDGITGSQEIVVKSVGPMLSRVRWLSGATIMGDGRVVLILDMAALVRTGVAMAQVGQQFAPALLQRRPVAAEVGPTVMVVDDSITVRKFTTRFLEGHGMQVVSAKDGLDAVALLQDIVPDLMLLDVEMPRMDGYELATQVRNDERLKGIPLIMITSRTAQKHRERAERIGVDRYLGKPFNEQELLDGIREVLGEGG